MMANFPRKEEEGEEEEEKDAPRVGGTWSIYLHSRLFGGQMYLGKYNTYIENLGYTFEHLYTARYGIIIGLSLENHLGHWKVGLIQVTKCYKYSWF